jgi:retron-type reverse transcriptase
VIWRTAPDIRLVEIPKKTGAVRMLGIATIEDRIAQTVAKV